MCKALGVELVLIALYKIIIFWSIKQYSKWLNSSYSGIRKFYDTYNLLDALLWFDNNWDDV
jgi:hypothetical protein